MQQDPPAARRAHTQPKTPHGGYPDGAVGHTASGDPAELLEGVRRGDSAAWEEVIRRYRNIVFATLRSFRLQEADVLDAVQMTWLRLAENVHQVQHPERLAGWLSTTARREALQILRQQARLTLTPADAPLDRVADPGGGPEQWVIDGDTANRLWSLVAKLSPPRRTLLRDLFADTPRPYGEVARSAGIPVGGIGPTRARALRQLRRWVDENELNPQA